MTTIERMQETKDGAEFRVVLSTGKLHIISVATSTWSESISVNAGYLQGLEVDDAIRITGLIVEAIDWAKALVEKRAAEKVAGTPRWTARSTS